MKLRRLFIYSPEVSIITGRTDRYSRKLLKEIKTKLNKEDHQYVTFSEFCKYTGIPKEDLDPEKL